MNIKDQFTVLLVFTGLPILLSALPQDLDTFIDFEDVSGEGDFIIGESPNMVRFINFRIESTGNSDLHHSGTRSLVLIPGQQGIIRFERGVNLLEFYAAETNGAGRIEVKTNPSFFPHPNGLVKGLPNNISPSANPNLLSFIAFSGDPQDTSDLNISYGIKHILIKNITGQFALDDLGFTLKEGSSNNTVFYDFGANGYDIHGFFYVRSDPEIQVNFTLGISPITATFKGGSRLFLPLSVFNHTIELYPTFFAWHIDNDRTGTITFETPAQKVQFYAAALLPGDGEIEVFDANNNLLTSISDIPQNMGIVTSIPPPLFDFRATELGAQSGIGRITYTNGPQIPTRQNYEGITLDDFGFTPIEDIKLPQIVPLVIDGSGDIAEENIQHPNGNIFDQVLLTGEWIQLHAKPGQITRVSFMDEDEDIVQVEYSGAGTFTVILDPATFLPPALPPRYNQQVEYVTGKPSVVIEGADMSTFFSIFTVGSVNAVNQALFPEGQIYDAEADVALVEVINSTGMGGLQLSNTVFSGSTGKIGVDARAVPIAVRLTIGDIDASGDAIPHLLFAEGSFTVPADNPGLRITGGDLKQTNTASIVVAESGSTTPGFETLISQNNFKSDNTPQPTQSINAVFVNVDGEEITVTMEEITVE